MPIAKPDPFGSIKPIERPRELFRFESEYIRGGVMECPMIARGPDGEFKEARLRRKLIEQYVTGNPAGQTEEERSPVPFFPVAGEAVEVSEEIATVTATIYSMQDVQEWGDQEPYTPEQVLAWVAKVPGLWIAWYNLCTKLNDQFQAELEKKGRTATIALSA